MKIYIILYTSYICSQKDRQCALPVVTRFIMYLHELPGVH